MGEKKIEPLVGKAEIADLLGCNMQTVDRARKTQGLPFYKIGAQVKFKFSEVEQWLKERKQNG